jgi:hypothetical protein
MTLPDAIKRQRYLSVARVDDGEYETPAQVTEKPFGVDAVRFRN